MSSVKILTVGSAAGSIRELLSKIKAIDAKHGKFALALCAGDFFGPPKDEGEEYTGEDDLIQLLEGNLEVPIECYVMQGEYPLPSPVIEKFAKTGSKLTMNVILLHKSGIITTPHGLRIACLGGVYESNIYAAAESAHGFTSPYFTVQTVEKLLANTLTVSHPGDQNYTSLAAIKATALDSQLVDVFISNACPSDITRFSLAPLPAPELASIGVEPVAEVVRRTKPRYHFAAGGGVPPRFWEREPFVWDDENGRITRFVSLGAFGGQPAEGKKQRWFYAFSITPHTPDAEAPPRPANATLNPFTEPVVSRAPKRALETEESTNYRWGDVKQTEKRTRTDGGEPDKPPAGYKCKICESTEHFITDCPDRAKPKEGYICKICHEPGHFVRDCPVKNAVGDTGGRKPREGYVCRACGSELHYIQDCPVAKQGGRERNGRANRGHPKEIAPEDCWFCLSNPNLAKHLIVSIGTECYVTLPKGQIVPTHTSAAHPNAPAVPGGGHVLIVPITHYPTYSSIPPDLAPPIVQETEKYKSALHAMYAKYGAVPVSFEVGRLSAKGGHAHVQAVPIPNKFTSAVEEAFINEGRTQGIEFEADPEEALKVCSGGKGSYFRVDLPDGRKMVYLLRDSVPFSLQFGRRQVLVNLLGMRDRFDWKACAQSERDDKADVEVFKDAFAPFDPSLSV
ncbi:nuclear protein [Laetiporus sulphureus 93-53]|uniref:Nuclear protein n=1 Tax=Laetiporus sulphureus 93-53 TaxID=1314785 RepID=A0A165G3N5_9APHY|nr:nuclear protein [Laetiporus sulphureus 93-53]KZT09782.1 nuclear protein [Laetiporus sulphureus 93-53]